MKRIYYPIFFLINCVSLVSCIESEFNAKNIMEKMEAEDGYVWYRFIYDGKYGIANEDGEVLTLPKYDEIEYISGDEYFELKKVKGDSEDTLIAIESKEHEKKIILQQGLTKYKREYKKECNKYFFRTRTLSHNDEEEFIGCYDKNWNVIVPMTMKGNIHYKTKLDYRVSEGDGFEQFVVGYKLGRRYVSIPLSICLNSESEVVYVKKKMEYLNCYNYHFVGEVLDNFLCIMIYRDFLIINNSQYAYCGIDNNNRIYCGTLTTSNGDILHYNYYVDEDYNITEKPHVVYEQQYNYKGDPIIWDIYDEIKEKCEDYNAELIKKMRTEIDEDAKLYSNMKKVANNRFWNKEIDEDKAIQDYKDAHEYEIAKLQESLESMPEFYKIKTERGHNSIGSTGTRKVSIEALNRAIDEGNSHRSLEKIPKMKIVPIED